MVKLLEADAECIIFPREVICWASSALSNDIVGPARELKDEEVVRFYELSSQGATCVDMAIPE